MALMKSPKDYLDLMAAKEAALDANDMGSEANELDEMCQCPKCGYSGQESEFKGKT
jgi:hypothetical protein